MMHIRSFSTFIILYFLFFSINAFGQSKNKIIQQKQKELSEIKEYYLLTSKINNRKIDSLNVLLSSTKMDLIKSANSFENENNLNSAIKDSVSQIEGFENQKKMNWIL